MPIFSNTKSILGTAVFTITETKPTNKILREKMKKNVYPHVKF